MRSIPAAHSFTAALLLVAVAACDGPTNLSSPPEIPEPVRNQASTTGLVPLTDLGSGFYLGMYQGGLYPGGSNIVPADHAARGRGLARRIQPLNNQGQPSSTG